VRLEKVSLSAYFNCIEELVEDFKETESCRFEYEEDNKENSEELEEFLKSNIMDSGWVSSNENCVKVLTFTRHLSECQKSEGLFSPDLLQDLAACCMHADLLEEYNSYSKMEYEQIDEEDQEIFELY
jgi:hypothetical protein